jgi:hypothetical protein
MVFPSVSIAAILHAVEKSASASPHALKLIENAFDL